MIRDEDFYGDDTIIVSARNKNGVTDLNITISVEPVNDPPFIITPEHIILYENEDSGSLIYEMGRNKFEFLIGDPDLPHFQGMFVNIQICQCASLEVSLTYDE